MKSFSERQGHTSVRDVIQIDGMDLELRNSLWNAVYLHYLKTDRHNDRYPNANLRFLVNLLWRDYFKEPIDTIPPMWAGIYSKIKSYFFSCAWFEVYDFIEFIAIIYPNESECESFREYCNQVMERELSGYRFVGETITPITSKEEIAEIGEALESTESLTPITIHLKTSLDLMSDRKDPDYRNSIKESISSVEAMCSLIVSSDKAKLPDALRVIGERINLHRALKDAFIKLYGYTSDAEGIRHALLDEPDLHLEDAKFMLVSCAAFINYLKLKTSKAGIKL